MIKKGRGQRIDTVFVLIIFCIFAISVLMVLMFGASIYQNMTEITREGQNERTVLSYIWTKTKNEDGAGRVTVGFFHGLSALFYEEEFDGVPYRTMIYFHDGWVYELFSDASLEFYPEDGVQIIRAENLFFTQTSFGLIKVSSGDKSLLLSPRSGITGELPFSDDDGEVFFG